jgi:hypothetical protein
VRRLPFKPFHSVAVLIFWKDMLSVRRSRAGTLGSRTLFSSLFIIEGLKAKARASEIKLKSRCL